VAEELEKKPRSRAPPQGLEDLELSKPCFSPILPRETKEDSFGMKLIQDLNCKRFYYYCKYSWSGATAAADKDWN